MARGVTSNSRASSLIENSAPWVSMLGFTLDFSRAHFPLGSLQHSTPGASAAAETIEVAPGIHWLSMPLPFALDHINLWVVQDEGGWAIVDTRSEETTSELQSP